MAIPLLAKALNYEILYFLGSYALVRGETRLEIVQHLQHVAYDQSPAYRANLLLALLFSEPESVDREFSNIDYSRIRIARKRFTNCRFVNFRLRYASLLSTSFFGCTFENMRIEGEARDLTISTSAGSIVIPSETDQIMLEDCPRIVLYSSGRSIRISRAEWLGSSIVPASNLELQRSQLRSVTLLLGPSSIIELSETTLREVLFLPADLPRDARRLPKLLINDVKITKVAVMFMTVTRDQYVNFEQTLRGFQGILVVDDPEWEMQGFRRKDDSGVTRYVGWEKERNLLKLSAQAYNRLDPAVLIELRGEEWERGSLGDWSIDEAAERLALAMAQAPLGAKPSTGHDKDA